MIQNSVKTSLFGLIGWRQSTVTGMPTVDAANLATSSGLYFQDFSSLLSIQNIYRCQEDAAISDANFNTLLANMTKAATLKVLNAVYTDADFIENSVVYPFENDWIEKLENDTAFVGFRFTLPNRKDLAFTINQVFTAFDGVDSLTLYLFHSSKKTPLQTKVITTAEDSEIVTGLDWVLSPFDYAGGRFYIGYNRGHLIAKAVNRKFEQAQTKTKFKTFNIEPVIVYGHDSATLFDVNDVDVEDETYGLNFDISVFKDYSNIVVQNKNRMVNAIGYQLAADVLDLILKSVRSNRIQGITEGQVLFELEGLISPDVPKTVGISKKLTNEIESLKTAFTKEPQLIRGTIG
jgi:hypothetical protein